jgi:methylmalonyl-CoA mutase
MADKSKPEVRGQGGTGGMVAGGVEALGKSFPEHTLEAWQEEVVRLLKGAPFEKRMLSQTYEGITLKPLYTRDDLEGLTQVDSAPGTAPYLRGTRRLGYRESPWIVAQELPFATCDEFNHAVTNDLKRGLSAVNLVLDQMGKAGYDADDRERLLSGRGGCCSASAMIDQSPMPEAGRGGTSVSNLTDMTRALKGINPADQAMILQPGVAALPLLALLASAITSAGHQPEAVNGAMLSDPVANLLGGPSWNAGGLSSAYDDLATTTGWAQIHMPRFKTLAACGFPYHEAGGSAVEELAFTISSAVTTLREMELRGLTLEETAAQLTFGLSAGTHFFMEIAKFRALRLLWHRVIEACGGDAEAGKVSVYCRGSRFTKTIFDPYVNVLRSTTESLAAVLGGCDMIETCPFDEPSGPPGDLARRLSRNTQLILREESHLDNLIDPAGGCWCVESLTDQLAEKAWALLQEVEDHGGLHGALRNGLIHNRINSSAAAREAGIASRRDVFVGTNKFPNPEDGLPADFSSSFKASATTLAGASREYKAAVPDRSQQVETLGKLKPATGEEYNLAAGISYCDAVIASVSAGVTIGDICGLSKPEAEELIPNLTARRGAAGFEALRCQVLDHRGDSPNQTQIFMANMGPVGRYMPRLDFTRSFYEVGGFAVASDSCFDSAAEAARKAALSKAPVVVIVGTDQTYSDVAAELASLLRALPSTEKVVLAGYPKDEIETFKAAGVDEFIHMRTDALASLRQTAEVCRTGKTAE